MNRSPPRRAVHLALALVLSPLVAFAQGQPGAPTAAGLRSLAHVYLAQGRHADAEMAARSALARAREDGGERSPDMIEGFSVLAEVYAEVGRLEEAAALFHEARARGRALAATTTWTISARARQVHLLRRHAEVLTRLGDDADAAELEALADEHEQHLNASFKRSLINELNTSPGLDLQKARRRKNVRVWLDGQEVEPYTLVPLGR